MARGVADQLDVAVIGAGPFGLSIAAHLQDRAVRVFGTEMETWRHRMPREMLMRSAWAETSLSAPGGVGTIDHWLQAANETRQEPIPLELFLRYSQWFIERFVADRDSSDIANVELNGSGYRLTTAAGVEVDARTIVLSVGVMPFAYVPAPLKELFGAEVALATGSPDDAQRYAGRRVLVVGGGQAGLESSGLAAHAGAKVELVTRSNVRWFADREPHHPRTPFRQKLYKLAYPVVGYGPPPLNRFAIHPDLFAALPESTRRKLTGRLLRSGGSPWLRKITEREVKITEHCTVVNVEKKSDSLLVRLSDGSEREVDDVIIACGYRFDLDRLEFLAPEVRSRIAIRNGWPVLDRYFRSTDPNVIFVGYAAENRFGALSRFVLGADFTATRVRRLFDK
jgi:cation diffusion facilitator CzcD-associated flavoprotein CzcO